jgi:hypothetical protein
MAAAAENRHLSNDLVSPSASPGAPSWLDRREGLSPDDGAHAASGLGVVGDEGELLRARNYGGGRRGRMSGCSFASILLTMYQKHL